MERPIDARLARKVALLLAVPLLLAALTVARPGPLPAPALPPSFDGPTALALTRELSRDHPRRVPGSPGADGAVEWFTEKMAIYGLEVAADAWVEDVPGLGPVTLRNLAVVIEGTLPNAIAIVAHRDNRPGSAGANDNASGTAALIELARQYATVGTGAARPRRPLHTLVFLSTDAGAYGALGAARFARESTVGDRVVAAITLDGLAGRTRPRTDVGGLERRSPTPALVRTLDARVAEEVGRAPAQPGALTQLVGLALPFAYGEQAPLLGGRTQAVRLGTAPDTSSGGGPDEVESLDGSMLARLGAATEATLGSLDAAVELPGSTAGALFLGQRAVRGWALQLLLLVAVAPFAAAVVDLLGRCRRRGLPLRPAWRSLRRRLGFWLVVAAGVFVAAVAGALPRDTDLPPAPDLPPLDTWPFATLAILALVAAGAWLRERALLAPRGAASEDEVLAGWTVALVALLAVAVVTAVVSPYSLVFVLPSLYAWLALAQLGGLSGWVADALFGVGLLGPVLALVVLAEQLDLGLRAPLYALGLMTAGVVPWGAVLALVAWAAVTAQVGALVAGRYAPVAPSRRR